MQITVNGKPETLADRITVEQLLKELQLDRAACAVEVNKSLIPKRRHNEHQLDDGDTVEIVTLVGGG